VAAGNERSLTILIGQRAARVARHDEGLLAMDGSLAEH
jgi:hypothetical protein